MVKTSLSTQIKPACGVGAILTMTLLLTGGAAAVVPANWDGAQVEETLLEEAAEPLAPGVSMAVSATRLGCRVAKLEGSALNGFVVRVDGVAGPRWPEIASVTPVFSAKGASVAYCARKGLEWRWVVNGVEGPPFSEMKPTSFAFSADGKRHAYVASPAFRRMVLVVDGVAGPELGREVPQPWDAAPLFSPDGKHLAFVEALYEERKMRVNLDGVPGMWTDGVAMGMAPGFGAYSMTGPQSEAGLALGRTQANTFCMAFSADGRAFGYHAEVGGSWTVVINGKPEATHDATGGEIVFAADGADYAYMGLNGTKRAIHRAKAPSFLVDGVFNGTLTFSPDGSHFAFAGMNDGVKSVWLDGKPVPCDVNVTDLKNHGTVCFSPDSKRLAFGVQSGSALHWVVDGKAGPSISGMLGTIEFSPDSAHFAYIGTPPGTQGIAIVEDGVVRAQYEAVAAGPVYLEDGRMEYLAVKGNRLYLVRVRR